MSYGSETRLTSNAQKLRQCIAGVQQILLASRAEVGLETLRKLERGEVVGMKLETIMRIAAALEVTPPDLIPALGMVLGVEDLPARRRRSAD